MKATERHKLIDRIKTIEGLTDDERASLLALLREHKSYGLVWEDKPEAIEEKLRTEIPLLKEVTAILSDTAAPNHILIEGDNLEALTALSYTHEKKINVIYIDPPYNTGNKDFIYNDSFVDTEDCYRHSKWLSFMNRRLRMAKKLLSDDGVMFISIDDNEQANLKLLCDDIFGPKNFIGTFHWKRTSTPPALSYKIRRKLEFVLCYQKTAIPQRTFVQGYVDGGDAPLLNSGNPEGILTFPSGTVHFGLPDGIYSYNNSYKIELLDNVIVRDGVNSREFRAKGNFKWGQKNLDREVSEGTYFLIKSRQFSPRFQKVTKTTKVPSNIIDENVNVGTNEDAQKEIQDFDLGITFDYTKPTSLVSYVIKMPFWYNKNTIILDFFAGSGTTLHAVMQLNAEDGGKRQCILCTNNENQICEKVTYERNKRVIEGYTKPNGEYVEGLHDNNLRYYKTQFVSRAKTPRNMHKLVNLSTDMLCIKENVYTEQKEMGGVKTHPQVFRYFDDGKKQMLIIYREEYIAEIVGILEKMDVKERIKTYVFSPSEDPASELFQSVEEKVELTAIPAAIYNAYKRVLPKPKDEKVGTHGSCVRDGDDSEEANEYETENLGGLFAAEGGEE